MPYERCIFYTVVLAVVALDRPTLKSKVGRMCEAQRGSAIAIACLARRLSCLARHLLTCHVANVPATRHGAVCHLLAAYLHHLPGLSDELPPAQKQRNICSPRSSTRPRCCP